MVGQITPGSTPIKYTSGLCFNELDFETEFSPSKDDFDSVTVSVTAKSMAGWFCSEYFLFSSEGHYHLESYSAEGTKKVVFKNISKGDQADIKVNGIRVFLWCDGWIDTVLSAYKVLLMFVGGLSPDPNAGIFGSHVPDYMAQANIEFLRHVMGPKIGLEPRKKNKLDINPDTIQSGDFMVVTRLDGLDPLIGYGTGSHSGHSVMALRFDGELYLVESQSGWYWPHKSI